eukprot:c19858_g2_i2.p1 GENE.c19858_g2_i2~~c19858_g2_i2.p1  ORF type:complete len:107 (+),score=21.26 c19858_g2_i2:36-356(+)
MSARAVQGKLRFRVDASWSELCNFSLTNDTNTLLSLEGLVAFEADANGCSVSTLTPEKLSIAGKDVQIYVFTVRFADGREQAFAAKSRIEGMTWVTEIAKRGENQE